uniref:Uncharacterized protein n=1 Tax=Nelumbo nucifera TaxID=4432 RepID=A0A822XLH6_NELNU|nr:TPA_asm: hypothetical protein HUJ06_021259 [Nelumbo nucifera]
MVQPLNMMMSTLTRRRPSNQTDYETFEVLNPRLLDGLMCVHAVGLVIF